MALKAELRKFFGDGEKRVAIVGIGSPIRADDAAGLAVVDELEKRKLDNVLLLRTEIVPESFTGVIRKFNPTHVLMVDAAYLNEKPGTAKIVPTDNIVGDRISTHHLPFTEFANFVRETITPNVTLLGIQPDSVSIGMELTPQVSEAIAKIADAIHEAILDRNEET